MHKVEEVTVSNVNNTTEQTANQSLSRRSLPIFEGRHATGKGDVAMTLAQAVRRIQGGTAQPSQPQ